VRQAQLASPRPKGVAARRGAGTEKRRRLSSHAFRQAGCRAKTGDEYGHGRDENYEVVVPGNRERTWQEGHEHGVFEIEVTGRQRGICRVTV